jgi:DNA polymerase II small subunit
MSSGNFLFANEVYYPEASISEKRKSNSDVWVAFISDLHAGSTMFLEKNLLKFIKWLNGKEGDSLQREIAKKVKYLFVVGDTIDGVNHNPGQEPYLNIKTTLGQYEKVEEMLRLIRKDLEIILCPGQHDAVWVGEPQPIIGENFAPGLHDMENVTLVPNPTLVELEENFKVLMYHGASINYFIEEIPEIRTKYKHNAPTKVVKEMLKRRHLAPLHSSADYIPCEEDSLVIDDAPDIIVTGDQHRSEVSMFNNILLVASSCWQSITPFEEKGGNNPEPCRVPLFNLKTREIKILDFSDPEEKVKEEAACEETGEEIVCAPKDVSYEGGKVKE